MYKLFTFVMLYIPCVLFSQQIKSISLGDGSLCYEAENNGQQNLYCMGRNNYGQLGVGDTMDRNQATQVLLPNLEGYSIFNVSAISGQHTCLTKEKKVSRGSRFVTYCFGRNQFGQLGLGSNVPLLIASPEEVPNSRNNAYKFISTSPNMETTCAATYGGSGNVYCTGVNNGGMLGVGEDNPGYMVTSMGRVTYASGSPLKVSVRGAESPLAVGVNFVCAIAGASVQCWGSNSDGQLGLGNNNQEIISRPSTNVVNNPTTLAQLNAVEQISAGYAFTCAVVNRSQHGYVKCWGHNGYGQLGNDFQEEYRSYASSVLLKGSGNTLRGIQVVAAGDNHACAYTNRDPNSSVALNQVAVYCWGDNHRKQLGPYNQDVFEYAAVKVQNLPGDGAITDISAAGDKTCILRGANEENMHIICWGGYDNPADSLFFHVDVDLV